MSAEGNGKKLKFVLKKVEVPVEIEYEDGTTHHFILRKANGSAIAAFRKVMLQNAKIQGNNMVGIGNAAEAEPVLIAQCMREVTYDGENKRTGDKPVSSELIRSWDYSLIRNIMDELKKISDMKDLYNESADPKERIAELDKERAELEAALAEEEARKNS
jgi:hypothetical protein